VTINNPGVLVVTALLCGSSSCQARPEYAAGSVTQCVISSIEWRLNARVDVNVGWRVGKVDELLPERLLLAEVGNSLVDTDGEDWFPAVAATRRCEDGEIDELMSRFGGTEDSDATNFERDHSGHIRVSQAARCCIYDMLRGAPVSWSPETSSEILFAEARRAVRELAFPWRSYHEVLDQLRRLRPQIGCQAYVDDVDDFIEVLTGAEDFLRRGEGNMRRCGLVELVVRHEVDAASGCVVGEHDKEPLAGRYNPEYYLRSQSRRNLAELAAYWDCDVGTRYVQVATDGSVKLMSLGQRVRILASRLCGVSGVSRSKFLQWCGVPPGERGEDK